MCTATGIVWVIVPLMKKHPQRPSLGQFSSCFYSLWDSGQCHYQSFLIPLFWSPPFVNPFPFQRHLLPHPCGPCSEAYVWAWLLVLRQIACQNRLRFQPCICNMTSLVRSYSAFTCKDTDDMFSHTRPPHCKKLSPHCPVTLVALIQERQDDGA